MMETIISWISTAIGQSLEFIIDLCLANLQLDLEVFVNSFPIVAVSYEIFQYMGLGLVVGIALFQLMKFAAGQVADVKDTPLQILVRSAGAVFMIWFGGHFISVVVDLARAPYDVFIGLNAVGTFGVRLASMDVGSLFAADVPAVVIGPGALLLLSLILMLLIGVNVLKLMIEVFERFLMVGLLAYSAPLIYPTLASQSTSQIFKRWVGMFFGQCILMTLSVWSLKLVLSGFDFSASAGGTFVRLIMTLAMCKIAQRIDTYMQQLGIGVASTGGNLLNDMVGTAMAMRSMTGGGKGRAPKSVLGAEGGGSSPKIGGLAGAASGAFRKGVQAFKDGKNPEGVRSEMKAGAKEGIKGGPISGTIQDWTKVRKAALEEAELKNTKEGAEAFKRRAEKYGDVNGTGGSYSKDTQSKAAAAGQTAQQYSQQKLKSDGAGSVKKGADGRLTLDETAQNAGLKWNAGIGSDGHPNQIKGTSSAVGEHMARNYEKAKDDPEYQASMVETAVAGSALAAEDALMNPNHELKNNDQVGAALLENGFGDGIEAVYGSEKDKSGNYTDMTDFSSALQSTRTNDTEDTGESVTNIKSSGDGKAKEGRIISCDYQAASGKQYKVDMMDKTAYHNLPEVERQQMKSFNGGSGETYYTRAASVSVEQPGRPASGPVAQPGRPTHQPTGGSGVNYTGGPQEVVRGHKEPNEQRNTKSRIPRKRNSKKKDK